MKTLFSILIFVFSFSFINLSAQAADKVFNCPDTGVAFEASKNVVPVTNPDGSIVEWRITATAFPESSSTVSNWLEVKARYSNVTTELECEAKVTDAETGKEFYTTASAEVVKTWKPCNPVPVEGSTNMGLHCLSSE